jgi:hypothetical protein
VERAKTNPETRTSFYVYVAVAIYTGSLLSLRSLVSPYLPTTFNVTEDTLLVCMPTLLGHSGKAIILLIYSIAVKEFVILAIFLDSRVHKPILVTAKQQLYYKTVGSLRQLRNSQGNFRSLAHLWLCKNSSS